MSTDEPSPPHHFESDWTPEQWAQWEADADQRDIEAIDSSVRGVPAISAAKLASLAAATGMHGVMPGGVQDRTRRLAAATTEAAVGRVVGSPL